MSLATMHVHHADDESQSDAELLHHRGSSKNVREFVVLTQTNFFVVFITFASVVSTLIVVCILFIGGAANAGSGNGAVTAAETSNGLATLFPANLARPERVDTRVYPSPTPSFPAPCMNTILPVPVVAIRNEIGAVLQREGMSTPAELGVQRGENTMHLISKWPNMKKLYAVDKWAQQENYIDAANVDNKQQESIYESAMQRFQAYKDRITVLRMFTSEAAKTIPDDSLDFIYVRTIQRIQLVFK